MHIAHIAAKHHHVPLLDGPRPGDQRKQARFADAVRANQANHTPCRDRQTDIAQCDGGAKLLTNVFQQGDGGRGILRRQFHCGNLTARASGQGCCLSSRT